MRGTPGSGKSTLASFLQNHVARLEPNTQMWNITWPETVEGCNTSNPYWILLNILTKRPLDRNDWLSGTRPLIIDEAQRSYKYTSLWNDLVKFIGPGFGIFCRAFRLLQRPISQGMGMSKLRHLFTFIQSNVLDSNGSQTQIFLPYSVVTSLMMLLLVSAGFMQRRIFDLQPNYWTTFGS